MRSRIPILLIVVGFVFLVALIACVPLKENYGEAISSGELIQISQILAKPRDYVGKTVILEGKIVTECPTGCWINLKDATGVIYVDLKPSGFALPQITGKEVVAQGQVKVRNNQPMLIGKGVRIK